MVPVGSTSVNTLSSVGSAIAEVADVETFIDLLKRSDDKPVILFKAGKLSSYTYVTRYREYFFVLKLKAEHDFSRYGDVVPVKRFYSAFGMNTV